MNVVRYNMNMTKDETYPLTIVGTRITLRDFTRDDGEAVDAYASDPLVTRHLDWGPNTKAQTEEFLWHVIDLAHIVPRQHFELGIMENATHRLIGGARITVRSPIHRMGDIGYVLRRDSWGQGYGTDVARLLIRFGLASLGLHRIEATCDPENQASRRILETCGMVIEGRRREHLWIRGHWRDSLLFAVLEPNRPGGAPSENG